MKKGWHQRRHRRTSTRGKSFSAGHVKPQIKQVLDEYSSKFPGRAPWIRIFQKQGDKYSHEDYVKACRAMMLTLMSVRMVNTLKIRLEMRKTGWGKSVEDDEIVAATAFTPPIGSVASKNHIIRLRRDWSLRENLEHMAHEVVHIYQYATNKLQYRLWSSDRKYHVRYAGQEMGERDAIPYRERPWEIEAREKSLYVLGNYKNPGSQPLSVEEIARREEKARLRRIEENSSLLQQKYMGEWVTMEKSENAMMLSMRGEELKKQHPENLYRVVHTFGLGTHILWPTNVARGNFDYV
jgi:hypothetical protein